jgi:lysozyme family protein
MANASFPEALELILRHEGGYVDHPLDPGGATNLGITRATLASWRGRAVSKAEVRALSRTEAAAIYRERYWKAVRADELPPGIDLVVFDAAVNSGPGRAIRWLQAALDVAVDGLIGPETLAAARGAEPKALITAFSRHRLGFLKRLVTFPTFGRGWTRRVSETEAAALALAGRRAARPSPPVRQIKDAPTMNDTKSLLTSRTLWSNLVGLAALLAGIVGIDASGLDTQGLADAIPQAVAAVSFIASSVFRIQATRRLV